MNARNLFSWRTAVVNSDLSSTTRHVLLTLAIHMNEYGEGCYPSTRTLSKETGLSERSVITHLCLAAKTHWIEISARWVGGQGWRRHQYRLKWPEKVLNEIQHDQSKSPKVLNVVPKGAEPDDRKVLNDVQWSTSLSTSSNSGAVKRRQPVLPDWIPPKEWQEYEKKRLAEKKPLTERTRREAIKTLDGYRILGESISDVLSRWIYSEESRA